MDIKAWCNDTIHGTGGFISFEQHELAVHDDRDVAIVEWTIRSLANIKCKGTAELLDEIVMWRLEKTIKED